MDDKKASTPKDGRSRTWTFVVYPDSAPTDWRDILDAIMTPWVESPLHEFDVNPTGEVKKPHWHILMMFEGKKSFEQMKALLEPLNCPIPQIAHNAKGVVRYMAHLDNPEKHQYPASAIIGHCGADVAEFLKPTSACRYELIREMMSFVRVNGIVEFQDLVDYAMEERFDDWFPLLCDNSAFVVGNYIKSQRHRMTRPECATGSRD